MKSGMITTKYNKLLQFIVAIPTQLPTGGFYHCCVLVPLDRVASLPGGQGPDYQKYLQPCISLFTL